jgi:hypothetical protein
MDDVEPARPNFHHRFEGTFDDDRTALDGRWEAPSDGRI